MNDEELSSGLEVVLNLVARHPELDVCREDIEDAMRILLGCFARGFKLLVCGNGGSAADSEHIVGELMKSFRFRRPMDENFRRSYQAMYSCPPPAYLEGALPAIALAAHTALSSAFANDSSAEGLFAQQVYGYGQQGDVLLALSTSGNSRNVVAAAMVARARGMKVVAMTGAAASALSELADVTIAVPETETYKVQELHLPVYHALCAAIEVELF